MGPEHLSRARRLAAAAAWLALAACNARPIPVSVQAGSTVLLPMSASDNPALQPVARIAFGGTEYADPQRGELVVQLDAPGGFELVTRLAFSAAAPVEALTRTSGGSFGHGLLLVADVPANAPLGTHTLYLLHRRVENGVTVETPLGAAPGTLAILPASVNAGGMLIDGQPTPSSFWLAGQGFVPFALIDLDGDGAPDNFDRALPEPSFGVKVTTPSGSPPTGSAPRFLSFAKVQVSYPAAVIDVLRVVATEPDDTLVWFEDDGAGSLTVYGLATRKAATPTGLGPLRVVFALDDAQTALLDLAQVSASLVATRDQFGADSIATDWNLSAVTTAIR